jgi:hypothetical protein
MFLYNCSPRVYTMLVLICQVKIMQFLGLYNIFSAEVYPNDTRVFKDFAAYKKQVETVEYNE